MSIKSLALNTQGLYSVVTRQDSAQASANLVKKLTDEELKQLHKIPETLKPDFQKMNDDLGRARTKANTSCSKYLQSLVAQNGVIDPIDTLAVLNSFDHSEFDSDGWMVVTEEGPKGVFMDYNLIDQMHDDNLVRDGKLQLSKNFLRDFIDGKYPDKIVIKPDISANADGQIRLYREKDSVIIKICDPSGADLSEAMLERTFALQGKCDELENVELKKKDKYVQLYTVSTKNKEKAIQTLKELVYSTLNPSYIIGEDDFGSSIRKPDGLCFSTDSAIVQKEEKLLKLNGKVIEGRFFFANHPFAGMNLVEGPRWSEASRSKVLGPSFLKYASTGSEVVNNGDKDKDWPEMTEDIIKASGLDINKDDFDAYLFTLLKTQFIHMMQRARTLGYMPRQPIQIDIAWDANETVTVPKLDSSGSIEVPRPILMEWNSIIN